jgi:hypothetical protein
MIDPRVRIAAFVLIAGVGNGACQLPRPNTTTPRMIEPRLVEPGKDADAAPAPNATPLRLIETQALGHLGRRLLHQLANGELTEDPVWRWSSSPDRYLDSALRMAVSSNPGLRLVDSRSAPVLAVTLLAFQLESGGSHQLVGAVEVQVIRADRVIDTEVIRAGEPLSTELPGDLSGAAGRLLQRLASDSLSQVTRH